MNCEDDRCVGALAHRDDIRCGLNTPIPCAKIRRERANRRVLEPRFEGQARHPGLSAPGEHLEREQRMSACFEEVIGDAEVIALEHFLPDAKQLRLQRRTWCGFLSALPVARLRQCG